MTEDEVRQLLATRTATIDPPPAPLPEIARLGRQRQRRQRILQVGGAAAIVMAVVLGGVGLRSVLDGATTAPPSGQQTSGLAGQPPTANQLYGDWRAVNLFGRDVRQVSGPVSKSLIVSFFRVQPSSIPVDLARGFTGFGWRGSDLCNTTNGIVMLSGNGTFRLGQTNRTQVGCPALGQLRFEAIRAVLHARSVRLRNRDLVLYSAQGSEIARFSRIGPAPVPTIKSHLASPHRSHPSKIPGSIAPPTK